MAASRLDHSAPRFVGKGRRIESAVAQTAGFPTRFGPFSGSHRGRQIMTVKTSRGSVAAEPWNKDLARAVEQACERAMFRLFSEVRDERLKQAMAQGFLAGVEWCFSEQSDEDIAKATLALGMEPNEVATGELSGAFQLEAG
jgi:hypothetical protein